MVLGYPRACRWRQCGRRQHKSRALQSPWDPCLRPRSGQGLSIWLGNVAVGLGDERSPAYTKGLMHVLHETGLMWLLCADILQRELWSNTTVCIRAFDMEKHRAKAAARIRKMGLLPLGREQQVHWAQGEHQPTDATDMNQQTAP